MGLMLNFWKRIIAELDTNRYNGDVLKNINSHLKNLQIALNAAYLKIDDHQLENTAIVDDAFGSNYVLKVLNELNRNADAMEKRILELKVSWCILL